MVWEKSAPAWRRMAWRRSIVRCVCAAMPPATMLPSGLRPVMPAVNNSRPGCTLTPGMYPRRFSTGFSARMSRRSIAGSPSCGQFHPWTNMTAVLHPYAGTCQEAIAAGGRSRQPGVLPVVFADFLENQLRHAARGCQHPGNAPEIQFDIAGAELYATAVSQNGIVFVHGQLVAPVQTPRNGKTL